MIVVITTPQLGRLLQGSNAAGKENKALHQWLQKHHASLQPTFPGVEDENMLVYFELVTQHQVSEEVLEELRQLPGIDGAYRKAAEEPPA